MRILFVKLGSIGDTVHTLPALAAVRRALPAAEISWIVERGAAEILRDNPFLDDLIVADTKALRRKPVSGETLSAARRQLSRLRLTAFDLALDFQGLIKSALIGKLSGARQRFGFDRTALREPAARIFYSATIQVPSATNIIYKNLALAGGALNLSFHHQPDELEFPISLTDAHHSEAATFATKAGGDFAILNPGGGWVTKLWSAERFGALADELWASFGLRSLVTFGPGENDLAERVARASRSGAAQACSLSLKGFYALAQNARVYVGGDTGPTHLAVAAKTPVVGLFGPTEWWRNGSPRAADICVERNDIGCRVNCHRRSCDRWICMDIEVERVVAAIQQRLQRAKAQNLFARDAEEKLVVA